MPLKYKKYTPDGLDKGLRIGCGALFGAFAALYVLRRFLRYGGFTLLYIGIPIGAALCAWLAYKKGDRFWQLDFELGGDRSFRYWLIAIALLLMGFIIWLSTKS